MLMNIYRSIDRTQVQFDFVVNRSLSQYDFEQEIHELGGRVFYAPRPSLIGFWHYLIFWWRLFSNHQEFRIIHAHHTSPALVYGFLAKVKGRRVVAHSHITGSDRSLKSFIKRVVRYPLKFLADKLLACSEPAAQWMFGRNIDVFILRNAISMEAFRYSEQKRARVRREINASGATIILHVGRFEDQKNHLFLVKCFGEYFRHQSDAKLCLIGAGPLRAQIESYVKDFGVEERVMFLGTSSDIASWMSAADVFLFPSRYEGLGMVLIEAQASGLPCVVSNGVPKDVAITDLVQFCSLEDGLEIWCSAIAKAIGSQSHRLNIPGLSDSGYEVKETCKDLMEIYRSVLRKS